MDPSSPDFLDDELMEGCGPSFEEFMDWDEHDAPWQVDDSEDAYAVSSGIGPSQDASPSTDSTLCQYFCFECNIGLSKKSALLRHLKTRLHSKNSRSGELAAEYPCAECGKIVTRFDTLRRHVKRWHPDTLISGQLARHSVDLRGYDIDAYPLSSVLQSHDFVTASEPPPMAPEGVEIVASEHSHQDRRLLNDDEASFTSQIRRTLPYEHLDFLSNLNRDGRVELQEHQSGVSQPEDDPKTSTSASLYQDNDQMLNDFFARDTLSLVSNTMRKVSSYIQHVLTLNEYVDGSSTDPLI